MSRPTLGIEHLLQAMRTAYDRAVGMPFSQPFPSPIIESVPSGSDGDANWTVSQWMDVPGHVDEEYWVAVLHAMQLVRRDFDLKR